MQTVSVFNVTKNTDDCQSLGSSLLISDILRSNPIVSIGKHKGNIVPIAPVIMYKLMAKFCEYANNTWAKYGVTIPPILMKALPIPNATDLISVG